MTSNNNEPRNLPDTETGDQTLDQPDFTTLEECYGEVERTSWMIDSDLLLLTLLSHVPTFWRKSQSLVKISSQFEVQLQSQLKSDLSAYPVVLQTFLDKALETKESHEALQNELDIDSERSKARETYAKCCVLQEKTGPPTVRIKQTLSIKSKFGGLNPFENDEFMQLEETTNAILDKLDKLEDEYNDMRMNITTIGKPLRTKMREDGAMFASEID